MSYRLSYFDARGVAEPIRWILSYGGQEFEDIRAPIGTAMPPTLPEEIKNKCRWGQVPLLEFEDKRLVQSLAVTRYVAKKFDLIGADDFESALCDEYVDTCRELLNAWYPIVREEDEVKKEAMIKEARKISGEKYLSKFCTILEENGGQRLVGKKLTWADFYLVHVINNTEIMHGIDLLKDWPVLKSFSEGVLAIPQIKEWIAKRPVGRF